MCSYVKKYAEFKNQTLEKSTGMQKCNAHRNIPGEVISQISTEMGYHIPQNLI